MFKIGLSSFIKRLSLRSNLNLIDSAAKISNLSKFIVQLHCNRWSDIADCLTFFRRFEKVGGCSRPYCSFRYLMVWLTIQLPRCQIEEVRKSLYVVASYRDITVCTQEIRKKIRARSSEWPITLISEEEKVSSFKNWQKFNNRVTIFMHLP